MVASIKAQVSLLRPGQVLAAPAFDDNGLLLAGEGSELNEKNLYLLKESDIKVVRIRKDNSFPWQYWKEPAERLEELGKKFSGTDDRNMRIIEQAIRRRLREQQTNK